MGSMISLLFCHPSHTLIGSNIEKLYQNPVNIAPSHNHDFNRPFLYQYMKKIIITFKEELQFFYCILLKEVLSKNGVGDLYVRGFLSGLQEIICAKVMSYSCCQVKASSV